MIGIYYIKCKINNKVYIGSSINIEQRIKKHIWMLKKNIHPNIILQNSFNKYNIDNFKFGIITICKEEELLKNEQFYINNNKKLFNIIVEDVIRPSLEKSIRNKISKTLMDKYKNNLIQSNDGQFKKGVIVWNKGKKYKSTDHLKVPKLNIGDRSKAIETLHNNLPLIEVYNYDNKLLYIGKSIDIINQIDLLKPYMVLRNYNGRNGYSPYLLQTINILKSCKTNKLYKGLIFKFKP